MGNNELVATALRHLREARPGEAAAVLQDILARDPDQPQALLLLGLVRADGPDPAAAEALFHRYLTLVPEDPLALHNLGKLRQRHGDDLTAIGFFERAVARRADFAPSHNDLGVSLHRLRRFDEALAALERAVAIDPTYAHAHTNKGLVLVDMGRPADAATVFRHVLTLVPGDAEAWHNLAVALYNLGELEPGIEACRKATSLDPDRLDAWLLLAKTLDRAYRDAEAQAARSEWARRQGPVVKPCTGGKALARVLLIGGAGECNVPTKYLFGTERFETIAIYLQPGAGDPQTPLAALQGLPPFDLAFNAVGDADQGAPFLDQVELIARHLTCPVLNPPRLIPPTRRDRSATLFRDIPGLVVPPTERRSSAELRALAAGRLERPLLVRPPGSHGGTNLRRVDDAATLADYLDTTPVPEHYVSEFRDYRSADGHYRKYRLIFVDRQVYAYHLAISGDWLVHYWRAGMAEAPWKLEEEEMFLSDYRNVFVGPAGDTVRAMALRLDLDYGGADCSLLPDGRVLLFEANASMLVHVGDTPDEPAFKLRHVPRIPDAVADLVARRLGR
jgi:tetratricopeptide (TPR) repeat protein